MIGQTILGIESAIAGGSIALINNESVVASWHSEENVARSEQLLPRISDLLLEAGLDRTQINKVSVSIGPGSFTGIRIGMATALGLSSALGVPCIGISALKSLAREPGRDRERMVVLPIGRSGYCWQRFQGPAESLVDGPVRSGKLDELIDSLRSTDAAVIAHHNAFREIAGSPALNDRPGEIVDIGYDLAVRIAGHAFQFNDGLEPFYASESYPTYAG